MRPIDYAEYKEVLDVLKRDDVDNSYQDLMTHEKKTLETVNNVIKYYRDEELIDGQFINQSIHTIFMRFFDVWNQILEDIINVRQPTDIVAIFTKNDRIIFIGITLIVIALILIFLQNSKQGSLQHQ
jgi:hypothetical protein